MQSKFSQSKQLQLTLKSRCKLRGRQFNKGPSHPSNKGVVINGVRWCDSAQRGTFGDLETLEYCTSVLVSAAIELIRFLVAGTVLCFGFSVGIMLITH